MAAVKASASPSPKLFADSAFDGAGRRGGRGRGRVDVKVSAGICKQSTFKLWSIKSEPKLARISVCRWKREDEDGLVACKAFASARSSASVSASTVTYNTKDASPPALPFRIGHGFDLHRLEPNLPLIIGGINIPHDRGCEAHSDGALGLPDIGQIFPDTDPKWKGATSSVFVKEAVRLMHEAGYELGNLDATLILQRPKLSPHKEVIQSKLCVLLGASSSVINIKAKTHEKVDSLGENRSIAAHTVVLLMKK